MSKLTAIERRILAYLYAVGFPTHERHLALACGLTERQVALAIEQLAHSGFCGLAHYGLPEITPRGTVALFGEEVEA
jgi:hypothetical protein